MASFKAHYRRGLALLSLGKPEEAALPGDWEEKVGTELQRCVLASADDPTEYCLGEYKLIAQLMDENAINKLQNLNLANVFIEREQRQRVPDVQASLPKRAHRGGEAR